MFMFAAKRMAVFLIDRRTVLTKCYLLLAITSLITRKERHACRLSVLSGYHLCLGVLENLFHKVSVFRFYNSNERFETGTGTKRVTVNKTC